MPDTIVTSKIIHQFENRLDKYWENHQMKIHYNEYGPPTRRKTVKNKVEEDDQEELPIEDQKVLRAETTQGNIK